MPITRRFFKQLALIFVGLAILSPHLSQSATTIEPGSACRYKVWFLKACIEAEHSQTVHLILSKGGIQCDITKHLTKVCIPSTDNKLPITPNKAMFKDLLEGNQPVSKEQLEEAIANMDPEDLPEILKLPASSVREKAEATILDEINDYNKSTLNTTTKPETTEFEDDLKKLLGIDGEEQNNQTNTTDQDSTDEVVVGSTVSNMMTELLKELNDVGSLKNQSSKAQTYAPTSTSINVTDSEDEDEAEFVDKLAEIFQSSQNKTSHSFEQNATEKAIPVTPPIAISNETTGQVTNLIASSSHPKVDRTLTTVAENPITLDVEKSKSHQSENEIADVKDHTNHTNENPSIDNMVRSATGTQAKNLDFAKKALSLSITAKPKPEQDDKPNPNGAVGFDGHVNTTESNDTRPWDILNRLKNRRQELHNVGRNQKMKTVLEEMGLTDFNQTDISSDSTSEDNARVIIADTNEATNIKGFFHDLPTPGNGSRVINWMIENMPNGKQTIVIL